MASPAPDGAKLLPPACQVNDASVWPSQPRTTAPAIVAGIAVRPKRRIVDKCADFPTSTPLNRMFSKDRMRVVLGKWVSVSVDLGGRRTINKNINNDTIKYFMYTETHKAQT